LITERRRIEGLSVAREVIELAEEAREEIPWTI